MAHTSCISNHKGGVGKTTCVAAVADALAREKQNVLVIDMDPQFNLTMMLIGDNVEPATTMADLLLGAEESAFDIFAKAVVTETSIPGVHIVPSSLEMDYVANTLRLNTLTSPALYLRRRLRAFADQYDFILIDTPPSLNLLTMNALASADQVIIPFLSGDKSGLKGVNNLMRSLNDIRDPSINPTLNVLGAVITGFDGREVAHVTTEAAIGNSFKILARVPRSALLQRGALANQTILQADRTSKASREYVNLAAHLMDTCGVARTRRARREDGVSSPQTSEVA